MNEGWLWKSGDLVFNVAFGIYFQTLRWCGIGGGDCWWYLDRGQRPFIQFICCNPFRWFCIRCVFLFATEMSLSANQTLNLCGFVCRECKDWVSGRFWDFLKRSSLFREVLRLSKQKSPFQGGSETFKRGVAFSPVAGFQISELNCAWLFSGCRLVNDLQVKWCLGRVLNMLDDYCVSNVYHRCNRFMLVVC